MTTSRDRVIDTLVHQPTDRAPRDLWTTPTIESQQADELAELHLRYPSDIVRIDLRRGRGPDAKAGRPEAGPSTDAWGCTWQGADRESSGKLIHSPLADLGRLAAYRPPAEPFDKASAAAVNRSCSGTSRFVLGCSDARLLDRVAWLRGKDAANKDLASAAPPLRDLVAMVHDVHCRELSGWATTEVDGVVCPDALGSADGLEVSPQVFRGLFKPLYRQYCDILHGRDKFAFFHTDGNIEPIFGDLVEIGFDAIHAPLFEMSVESLAEAYRDRVTFWGGLDARTLRAGTPGDVKALVRRVRAALDSGRGGVIAQCLWSHEIPLRNVVAAFDQWLAPMPMPAQA